MANEERSLRLVSSRLDEVVSRAHLQSGGGGGTFNGMEARVKALEDGMSDIKSDLKAIRNDLAYLRGKVDSMPSTLQLGGFILAVLGIAGLAKYFAP